MSHRYAFSTRGVLRHLRGGLFQEYCLANGLLLEPDLVAQNDIDVDGAVEAIQSLSPERRTGSGAGRIYSPISFTFILRILSTSATGADSTSGKAFRQIPARQPLADSPGASRTIW